MSGSTAPNFTPAPPSPPTASGLRTLPGKHLAWSTLTAATKQARVVLDNLGVGGRHVPTIADFDEPHGFGFAAPDPAYLAGVTGFVERDGVALAPDSPVPTLFGPAEVLAIDLRAKLAAMPGTPGTAATATTAATSATTKLEDVEAEIERAGGADALALFRTPTRVVNLIDGPEIDAIRTVDATERSSADLAVGATGRREERRRAQRERRRQVEAARAGGA